MTARPQGVPTAGSPTDAPERWTRATLVEPSESGFVHIGVASGPWRVPWQLPRARRRRIPVAPRPILYRLHRGEDGPRRSGPSEVAARTELL
jgi:hypothetical protein